jgi:cytochrome c-type biogenesis protein CcsB
MIVSPGTQDILLKAAFVSYLLTAACFILQSFMPKIKWDAAAGIVLDAGFALHTAMIGMRWFAAGRPPFANMYEALVLFSWAIVCVYLVFRFIARVQSQLLAVPVNILAIIFMFIAFQGDSAIKPLMPALQSPWMSVHVITYFIGYAALSIAFMMGGLYLALSARKGIPVPLLGLIDDIAYRLVAFGFPFLTMGMLTGSVWANAAWGTYWNWDPKETCSLIIWLVYVIYLHLYGFKGWRGKKAAWLLAAGFLATLFTFVGVNFILPGLHSYGSV